MIDNCTLPIPKIIHYCWFGGNPKTKLINKCIKSWEKYCPGYQIIEWNENNFDINMCPLYVKQAYETKKWAFVTDYVRLKIIFENGGIYFDTDVELIRPIDDLLCYDAFFGIEKTKKDKYYIATGLGFGAIKGYKLLFEMMSEYDDISFLLPNNKTDSLSCLLRNDSIFSKYGYNNENMTQIINENTIVLSSDYLCPMDWSSGSIRIEKQTYSIHHYDASWFSSQERDKLKQNWKKNAKKMRYHFIKTLPNRILQKILGLDNYNKLKQYLKK